jgi:hypothetical protein
MPRFAKCYSVKLGELFRGAASRCFAGSLSGCDAGLGGASLKWAKAQESCRSLAPWLIWRKMLGLRSPRSLGEGSAKPSLETWRSSLIRGVALQMRDQAACLTSGEGAGGRSLGSIFCIARNAALYLPPLISLHHSLGGDLEAALHPDIDDCGTREDSAEIFRKMMITLVDWR